MIRSAHGRQGAKGRGWERGGGGRGRGGRRQQTHLDTFVVKLLLEDALALRVLEVFEDRSVRVAAQSRIGRLLGRVWGRDAGRHRHPRNLLGGRRHLLLPRLALSLLALLRPALLLLLLLLDNGDRGLLLHRLLGLGLRHRCEAGRRPCGGGLNRKR